MNLVNEVLAPIIESPEEFYASPKPLLLPLKNVTKALYDYGHPLTVNEPLPRLFVRDFESEQIWEQINLATPAILAAIQSKLDALAQNDSPSTDTANSAKYSSANSAKYSSISSPAESNNNSSDDRSVKEEDDEEEDDEDDDEDENENQVLKPQKKVGLGVTNTGDGFQEGEKSKGNKITKPDDHDFYSLDAMEQFVDEVDELADQDDIDLGQDPGEGGGGDLRYDQFFDQPSETLAPKPFVHSMDPDFEREINKLESTETQKTDSSDTQNKEEGEGDATPVSKFQKQNKERKAQISELEQKILEQRPWDQIGEVSARDRPADSLLEADLDFDFRGRVEEPITEEVTKQLEDLIKQRIADEAWDDVERKVEVKEKTFTPQTELSSEGKDRASLASIYERDYIEEAKKSLGQLTTVEEKLNVEHEEIARAMAKLFHKLDALSNFHFTPKPPIKELTVKSTTPALQMEDITPSAENVESTRAAPQEIFKSQEAGTPAARTELSQGERKSKRSAKRKHRKKMKLIKEQENKDQARAVERQLGLQVVEKAELDTEEQNTGKKRKKKNKKGLTEDNVPQKRSKKLTVKEHQKMVKSFKGMKNVKIATEVDHTRYGKSAKVFSLLQAAADAEKGAIRKKQKTSKGKGHP